MHKYICFGTDAKKLASLPVAPPHRRPARKGAWLNGSPLRKIQEGDDELKLDGGDRWSRLPVGGQMSIVKYRTR